MIFDHEDEAVWYAERFWGSLDWKVTETVDGQFLLERVSL